MRRFQMPILTALILFVGQVSVMKGNDVVQELTNLKHQWSEAEMKRDTAFLDRLFADDLVIGTSQGDVLNKQQMLQRIQDPEHVYNRVDSDNIQVRVYGNVAIMTDHTVVQGTDKGQPFGGDYRYVRTFVNRNGAWKVSLVQATPLKASAAAAKPKPADDEKELIELDKQWVAAAARLDTDYLNQLFTDDFFEASAGSGGEISNKQNLFKKVHAPERKIESITVDDIHVHLYGDFALVTDRSTFKGTIGGKDVSGDYRVLRVYIRQQGRWRAAGAELCRMAPSAYTTVHAENDTCTTCPK